MKNISDVVNFNSAYYGGIAGIERAELVLKYKQPGFEGSGGFMSGSTFGPQSDVITGNFGFLAKPNNGFLRKISSRTNQIPVPGEGNIDFLLAANDSKNYNKLPYFTSEKIFFSLDNTKNPDQYYTGGSPILHFTGGNFSGSIRIPPKVMQQISDLGEETTLCSTCDIDGDSVDDDVVVNRVLGGIYEGKEFSIIPYVDVFYYSGGHVNYNEDIAIREDLINQTGKLYFGSTTFQQKYSPISQDLLNNRGNGPAKNIIIADSTITKLTGATFKDILEGGGSANLPGSATGINLSIGIVNLLRTAGGSSSFIYPFLEYQFSFPQPVSDTFYTILGNGLVGDYNVRIYIKKSTNKQESIGDFTVIF